jgi:DNA-directed RNA polymerase alpha subunit
MEVHGGPQNRKRRKKPEPDWVAFMSTEEKEQKRIEHWQTVSLADVGLPVRIANTLEHNGVMTVGDLMTLTLDDMRSIQNLGEITIRKCIKLLNDLELPNNLTGKKKG